MEKTIYTVSTIRYTSPSKKGSCDQYDEYIGFSLRDARDAARREYEHLTDAERRRTDIAVLCFTADVLDGETAQEAYFRLIDEDELPDPAFSEPYVKLIPTRSYLEAYADLRAAALKPNATQQDLATLARWFDDYDVADWNGECYDIDEGLSLYPIYGEPDEYEDRPIIGYDIR